MIVFLIEMAIWGNVSAADTPTLCQSEGVNFGGAVAAMLYTRCMSLFQCWKQRQIDGLWVFISDVLRVDKTE